MVDFIKNRINGKRILILGFGREGQSTYAFLKKHFPAMHLTIADKNNDLPQTINDDLVTFHTGEDYLESINSADLIFKTPGISLNHLSLSIDRAKITSQTDVFLAHFAKQIIGITGTKGKSTTSSLVYHILKLHTDHVILVGNIGVPPFDLIGEISDNTKIVFELSSHQLEYVSTSPHIGILLNIFQEHLDHYASFKDYQQSKINIARYQNKWDNLILNIDDELIRNMLDENKLAGSQYACSLKMPQPKGCWLDHDRINFSDGTNSHESFYLSPDRYLKGEHNIRNIMAAVCACKLTGIPFNVISEGVSTFKGLEHRIEYVGEFKGVKYYNDSIATIPEATIEAIKTLGKVETLILGGFDRGINYDGLIQFLINSSVKNIVMLGDAGQRIMRGFSDLTTEDKNLVLVDTFEDAVKTARFFTLPKGTCLLSPAAASYDMFENFEERGRVYKKLVRDS